MQASNVKRLIATELAGRTHIRNSHGITLDRCLVEPRKVQVKDPVDGTTFGACLVLEEEPGSEEGYVVVYIGARQPWALGYWKKNNLVLMYWSAAFVSAVENM